MQITPRVSYERSIDVICPVRMRGNFSLDSLVQNIYMTMPSQILSNVELAYAIESSGNYRFDNFGCVVYILGPVLTEVLGNTYAIHNMPMYIIEFHLAGEDPASI